MAGNRLWDAEKLCLQAPRVGPRESGIAAATRRVEGAPATATADGDGPDLLGSTVKAVDGLAAFVAGGPGGDGGRLASARVSTLLDLEESATFGSPAISTEVRDLIRQMSRANPLWGAPRVHCELLKLGITVSQATVSKYMLRPRRPLPSQVWRTFLKNHAGDLMALDFFTVPTATFRVLLLVVLSHGRRRLVHFNVTEHPTAEWTTRQLLEACGLEEAPWYLIRHRDQVYGERFSRQARMLDDRERQSSRLGRRGKTPMPSGSLARFDGNASTTSS
jgi:hypothetical protein